MGRSTLEAATDKAKVAAKAKILVCMVANRFGSPRRVTNVCYIFLPVLKERVVVCCKPIYTILFVSDEKTK